MMEQSDGVEMARGCTTRIGRPYNMINSGACTKDRSYEERMQQTYRYGCMIRREGHTIGLDGHTRGLYDHIGGAIWLYSGGGATGATEYVVSDVSIYQAIFLACRRMKRCVDGRKFNNAS